MEQFKLVSADGTTYLVKEGKAHLRMKSGFQFPFEFESMEPYPPKEGETVVFKHSQKDPFTTSPIEKVEKVG